jgi:uncharacterized SAM-binding protein YcdF (DUF218 family)
MFFILSKILQFLFSPVFWIVLVVVLSLIIKRTYTKRILFVVASVMLLFFTNTFIADEFMRQWEIPAVKHTSIQEPFSVGVLLTGMGSWDPEYERFNFDNSSDRILQTMDLYNRGVIKKIFVSGGSGDIRQPEFREAALLHDYLVRNGIPDEDVDFESKSRNTAESAMESAQILHPETSDSTFLLITSAYHMRRAAGCFEKQGFDVQPYSTDRFTGERKLHFEYMILPRLDALIRWKILMHEWNGYWIYKLRGYV